MTDTIKVAVETETYGDRHEDHYGPGEYDYSWEEHNTFDITSVRRAKDNDSSSYGTDNFIVADTGKVYVVVVRYSSGDSFGHSTGNGVVAHVFGDECKARTLTNTIEKVGEDDFSIAFVDDVGRDIKFSNPAAGYFESLDSVSVEVFTV